MAGFNDSNDIKINVTVDTKDAIESAKALGQAFKDVSKVIGVDFKQLSNAAKVFSQAQIAQIKANSNEEVALIRSRSAERVADIKKRTEEFKQGEENKRADIVKTTAIEVQKLREAQDAFKQYQITRRAEIETNYRQELQGLQNTLAAIKETENTKRTELKTTAGLAIQNAKNEAKEYKNASGERIATIRAESANYKAELQKDTKVFQQTEATKRAEIKKTIDDVRLEAAKVRQATAESQLAGAGKSAAGLSKALSIAPQLAAAVFLAEKLGQAIQFVAGAAFRLAESANRVQALSTAFSTLQQSVGRDPERSILRLREATQGLISDTDLYQKANQAVLLGVPAKLFEESAEAAVKLGRAMGIDAVNALESLSIGLGRQSRLYLDNLGIVVSATEAYQNFARENNITGRELTDAEKRLAFFNETSKQLRDGLARLPPIQRDVGIAFTELKASTENAKGQFLTAYNSSQELQNTFSRLNQIIKELEPTFTRLGQAIATLFARALDFDRLPPIFQGIGSAIGIAADKLDNFMVLSEKAKRTRFTELQTEIAKLEERLSGKGFFKPFGGFKDQLESDLRSFKAELVSIGVELDMLDTKRKLQKEQKINLRINTEQLSNDIVETESTINRLKASVEESLGLIKIPGLDPEALNAAIPQLDAVFLQIEKGKITAEQAGAAVEGLINSLAIDISKTNLDLLNKKLKEAKDLLAAAPENEDRVVAVKTLEKQIKLQEKSTALEQVQREQLIKLAEQRRKIQKEIVDKGTRDANRLGQATKDVIGDLRKEFEKFGKKARQSLDEAIPTDIQREILELFRNTRLTTAQFAQALGDLAVKANASGADMEVFKEIIKDLQDQINKGIKPLDLKIKTGDGGEDPVAKVKDQVFNIREQLKNIGLEFGSEGGFFGFDLSSILGDEETQKQIASSIQSTIERGLVSAVDALASEDYDRAAREIGATIGAAVGQAITDSEFGGQVGAIIGAEIGEAIYNLGKDSQATKQRKSIDSYFAELFDGDRLAIIISPEIESAFQGAEEDIRNGIVRISDLTFEGGALFGGGDFGGEGFRDYFNTLSTDIQASFNGVGLALGRLQGISVEQSRLIGVALANNVGGSLQNLQILIQATGESFEDLANAILTSFLDAQLTIEEAYNALVQLQDIYAVGIPGAVGAYEQAIQNLNRSLRDKAPGRAAIDSLRDIGAEGAEAGQTFQNVISALGATYNFTAQQQAQLFEALRINGITSLAQLQAASDQQLLAILENIRRIRENSTQPLVTTPQIPTSTTSTPRASGPKGQSPEEKRKEALKKLNEEIQKLLRESNEYEKTLERLKNGELSNVQAGAQIIQIRQQIERLLKERNNLEKEYEDLIAKGAKANKKRLAEVAAALDANKKAIDKLTESTKEGERTFKKLNISAVIPLIKSANSLGVVSRLIGVDLKNTTNILVQGFLRGKLTLQQFNEQLKATQDNLGKGIPNEVGAVTKAFQNLVDAGVQGGKFSTDAFTDIFAEFREKFQQQSSIVREGQRKDLLAALENAKAAQKAAIGPEVALAAQKTVDAAEKALTDFYNTVPTPSLADLRSELENTFGTDEVAKFFRAIDESGLGSFQDLESAGDEAIVKILARLTELGFKFGETSQEVRDVQKGLNDAANAANGNTDPIQAALDLVKQFNEGANGLPPAFDKTTEAVSGLNDTLVRLRDGFDDIIEKLAQLDGNEFKNDVVFNIRTTGDTSSKALVELLFGDGLGTADGTGNGGGSTTPATTTSTTAAQIARKRRRLGVLQKSGRGNSEEAKRLRREIRELEG